MLNSKQTERFPDFGLLVGSQAVFFGKLRWPLRLDRCSGRCWAALWRLHLVNPMLELLKRNPTYHATGLLARGRGPQLRCCPLRELADARVRAMTRGGARMPAPSLASAARPSEFKFAPTGRCLSTSSLSHQWCSTAPFLALAIAHFHERTPCFSAPTLRTQSHCHSFHNALVLFDTRMLFLRCKIATFHRPCSIPLKFPPTMKYYPLFEVSSSSSGLRIIFWAGPLVR